MKSLKNTAILIICIILLLDRQQTRAELCGITSIDDYINTMLSLYEKEEIPPNLKLEVALHINHASIIETASAIHLAADLQMSWQDPRLKWNSMLDGCESIRIDAERLWLPDLVLLNGGASIASTEDPQKVKLYKSSIVEWSRRIDIVVPCSLELREWPTDTQQCNFKFGSRHYTTEIEISVSEIKYDTIWNAGAWQYQSSTGNNLTMEIAGETYSIVEWIVTIKRRSPAHRIAINAVFTAIILEFVTAALISPSARISIFACISFSATLWLVAALIRIPSVSASPPMVLTLMSALLMLSCVAALFAAIVQRIARHQSPPPILLKKLLTKIASVIKIMPEQNSDYGDGACVWVAAATFLDHVLITAGGAALLIIVCIYLFI